MRVVPDRPRHDPRRRDRCLCAVRRRNGWRTRPGLVACGGGEGASVKLSVKPEDVVGLLVAIKCKCCDGTGRCFATERSRHESPCEECDGTGHEHAWLPVELLRCLL